MADSGRGIPAGELDQVFQPFYRSEEVGQLLQRVPGWAVHRAFHALAYGGRIEVKSEAGHGSVFRLFIPLVS